MKIEFTEKFVERYHWLPKEIQKKVDKQINFLYQNLRTLLKERRNMMKKEKFGRQE